MKKLLASLAVLTFASCGGGTDAPALAEADADAARAHEAADIHAPTGTETMATGAVVVGAASRGDAPGHTQKKKDIETTDSSDIYIVQGYGAEGGGDQTRCVIPYEGNKCYIPHRKKIKIDIKPHNHAGCYGQYWTDAITRAVNGWNSFHLAYQTGFELVTSGSASMTVTMYCDADWQDGGSIFGGMRPGSTDCYDLGSNKLCRMKTATVILAGNNLINGCNVAKASATACEWAIENAARHELGHVMGLGHFPLGQPSFAALMGQMSNGFYFSDILTPTEDEAYRMCAYNPSGRESLCPW